MITIASVLLRSSYSYRTLFVRYMRMCLFLHTVIILQGKSEKMNTSVNGNSKTSQAPLMDFSWTSHRPLYDCSMTSLRRLREVIVLWVMIYPYLIPYSLCQRCIKRCMVLPARSVTNAMVNFRKLLLFLLLSAKKLKSDKSHYPGYIGGRCKAFSFFSVIF